MNYVCRQCGSSYPPVAERFKCDCGSALSLDYEGCLNRSDIKTDDFSMWRYCAAFPMERDDIKISFGEGLTPLAEVEYRNIKMQVKQDHLMPTGSFKDRGVAMVTNFMNNLGVRKFSEDSSGNGGSSFAGYCALAGIDCRVFVPANTSLGKVVQTSLYGADLIRVEGSRQDVADRAMTGSDGYVYVGHNWHPFFIQGIKSLAYELWEQGGFRAPDNVVCVAGNGSMVAGLSLGFNELKKSGEIVTIPKLFAVQADQCNPLYRDFVGESVDFEPKPTIAEGISIYRSTHHDEVVGAVKAGDGQILSVSDAEIAAALFYVGKKGFYVEPTSATAFAGLDKLIENKLILAHERTVVIISGNGLKATDKIGNLL